MFENAVLGQHRVEDVEQAMFDLMHEAEGKTGFEREVYADAIEALRTVVKTGYTRNLLGEVLDRVPLKEGAEIDPAQTPHIDRAARASHAERNR